MSSETFEYEPVNISWYKNQWYHHFKILTRPDYISNIMMRAPHQYVVDATLKYGRYIQGTVVNAQQLVFFTDDEGTDAGIAAYEVPHVMEVLIVTSKTDSKITLLITGYDRAEIDGIDNLKVFYKDLTGARHEALFNYSLRYDALVSAQAHPELPLEILNHPLPDTEDYWLQNLSYKTFDEERKVVLYLDELADVYRKFFVYLPQFTPPRYVSDRKAQQGGKRLKKYIHIYRFICNNEIISEFNHGGLMNTEEPDLYEMQFFMDETGKPLNIPCAMAPANRYRLEIEFGEQIPGVQSMCFFAELGIYKDRRIPATIATQATQYKIKASTPIEFKLNGGLSTWLFLMPHLNKSKSSYT